MSSRLTYALEDMREARKYTLDLLKSAPDDRWLEIPPGGVTNIAWQVGHIAMAQYRLGLARIRDSRPEDEKILPARYFDFYGKGTIPTADPARNETPGSLRQALDDVFHQIEVEAAGWKDDELETPCLLPHPRFTRKIDSLAWCARHEMLHAGQIGLVRRMLGFSPTW